MKAIVVTLSNNCIKYDVTVMLVPLIIGNSKQVTWNIPWSINKFIWFFKLEENGWPRNPIALNMSQESLKQKRRMPFP